ncbi:uncharacterized protein LOC126560814 [Anopheles maculipalpis]|uniref:uncharacterized protein LOC126560814 n=1 Tax=Anopheles maculipalpis TaxID=1496333 RepID=UPI002158F11E|nr:uncharacterized protein LOC126560814 [Anopheles maculipalpis]
MERALKKSVVASKHKPEQQEEPEELDYDSEDVMIEFIKVECGKNPDSDPFISSVEVQDDQLVNDDVFPELIVRTKRQKNYSKHKLNSVATARRDRAASSTRDQVMPTPSLKTKSTTPEAVDTFTEAITSDKSIVNLLSRTEQKLTKLETSLMEINGKLDLIGDQFQSILHNVAKPPQKKRTFIDIGFKAIDSLEQLESFNEQLAQPDYEEKIFQWLEGYVSDGRSENRMADALDVLFTRKFLTQCSWTGIGKGTQKIAMMQMTNVTRLFQRIGTTATLTVNHKRVAIFFMKKLKNAYKRAQAKGFRKTVSSPSTSPQ